MEINTIEQYVTQALEDRSDLFLVSCKISIANDIFLTLDGDQGASVDDCIMLSRYVEQQLDRDEEDFSLTVSTPDILKPLELPRQYKKNLGRTLKVKTTQGKIEGTLVDIKDQTLVLEYKTRVPKTIGKGKQTVVKQEKVPIKDITKATVKIVFNS